MLSSTIGILFGSSRGWSGHPLGSFRGHRGVGRWATGEDLRRQRESSSTALKRSPVRPAFFFPNAESVPRTKWTDASATATVRRAAREPQRNLSRTCFTIYLLHTSCLFGTWSRQAAVLLLCIFFLLLLLVYSPELTDQLSMAPPKVLFVVFCLKRRPSNNNDAAHSFMYHKQSGDKGTRASDRVSPGSRSFDHAKPASY